MANETKNPIFWSVILFIGGIASGIFGWVKNESTNADFARGANFFIWAGVVMIVIGIIGFFTVGNRKV